MVDDKALEAMAGREASCGLCGTKKPSHPNLAFFEFRGEGSRAATAYCQCGYTMSAHDEADPHKAHVIAHCRASRPAPTSRGAVETDSYYCGCRGWD